MVIAVAIVVAKVLVLLVPGLMCVAVPGAVQRTAVDVGRTRGLSPAWQAAMLTDEFTVTLRICGASLLVMAALLGVPLLRAW